MPILNPHTGKPMTTIPETVHVFNPKTDITVDEIAEVLMLVLSAQRFALTTTEMFRDVTKRHFDEVPVNPPAANEGGVGAGSTGVAETPSIGPA